MSDIINIISQALGEQQISELSARIGESPEATKSAIEQALPLLIGGLSSHGDAGNGWKMLTSFLDANNDGAIFDDIAKMIFGGTSAASLSANSGKEILKNILGENVQAVERHLESTTSLSSASIAKLLPLVAPLVIGALAKVQKTNNLNESGLLDLLKIERQRVSSASPQSQDLLTSLFDRDGDGSVVDDLAGLGANVLGKLMR